MAMIGLNLPKDVLEEQLAAEGKQATRMMAWGMSCYSTWPVRFCTWKPSAGMREEGRLLEAHRTSHNWPSTAGCFARGAQSAGTVKDAVIGYRHTVV